MSRAVKCLTMWETNHKILGTKSKGTRELHYGWDHKTTGEGCYYTAIEPSIDD